MNTIKKGDSFERKILNLFNDLVDAGQFFATPYNCKINHKKGYYSRDREKNIIFDVSIEIFMPGQETYSFLVLIECKNYNHSVPVDDAEEFFQKTQQISGANIKGIIASTNSFQEGTLKFSNSKGLGLLRYFEKDHFNWVLTRSPSALVDLKNETQEWLNSYRAITQENFRSSYIDSYFNVGEKYTNSLNSFLSALLIKDTPEDQVKILRKIVKNRKSKNERVPFIKEEKIEKLTETLLDSIKYRDGVVDVDQICEILKNKKNLQIIYCQHTDSENYGVLGEINFNPLEIKIYSNESEIAERQRFTLAHELGHYYLDHSTYMSKEKCYEKDIDLENQPVTCINDIFRMEWQANYFASCLLLPKTPFVEDFSRLIEQLEISNRGYGPLYLDNQNCNLNNYYFVSGSLKSKYKVSRTALKLRLIKLGLLQKSLSTTNKILPNKAFH